MWPTGLSRTAGLLRAPFLALVKDDYGAEPQLLDFAADPEAARLTVNHWVEDQTKKKIQRPDSTRQRYR